jgi:salicylate hydroxylase
MGGMGSALALAVKGFKNIHVWESASTLGEVGAGINITPNLSRILQCWGVLDIVTSDAVSLASASVLRECRHRPASEAFPCSRPLPVIESSTDETLTNVDMQYVEKEFGHPFYVCTDVRSSEHARLC